ncbi:hypothetical protein MTR62_21170, partial [Novosphingobium sp. 1949]|nr:hypothetical protein [Novosphingobium organovorum]
VQRTHAAQAMPPAPLAAEAASETAAEAETVTPDTPAAAETLPATARTESRLQPGATLAHATSLPQPAALSGSGESAAASTTATGETPQDFATLVSRLHEARENQGGNVVRTALVHAQFGPVSLQFRPDETGMSVSLASADPDFAPSVQAAAASALATGTGPQGEPGRE